MSVMADPRDAPRSALAGQVALVTGGSGGIGTALCQRLAAEGAQVVATCRSNLARGQALIASLPGSGHRIAMVSSTHSDQLTALVDEIRRDYGRLDMLVNNAGTTRVVPHADLDDLDDETIDEIFRVNWRGCFAAARACRAELARSGAGLIVNISSIAARTGVGSNIAYCASKAALDSLTMTLARALAPAIRVVSLSPGWVEGEYADRAPPDYLDEQRTRTPLGRIANPGDVADALVAVAVHLRFTTGAVVPVDGGRPLN